MYGLDDAVISRLQALFRRYPDVDEVILYGSRAKGTYREGSDIDFTLLGKNLSLKIIYAIEEEIEELLLPYSFDLSLFEQIDNPELIDHIKRVGKVFYKRVY